MAILLMVPSFLVDGMDALPTIPPDMTLPPIPPTLTPNSTQTPMTVKPLETPISIESNTDRFIYMPIVCGHYN